MRRRGMREAAFSREVVFGQFGFEQFGGLGEHTQRAGGPCRKWAQNGNPFLRAGHPSNRMFHAVEPLGHLCNRPALSRDNCIALQSQTGDAEIIQVKASARRAGFIGGGGERGELTRKSAGYFQRMDARIGKMGNDQFGGLLGAVTETQKFGRWDLLAGLATPGITSQV